MRRARRKHTHARALYSDIVLLWGDVPREDEFSIKMSTTCPVYSCRLVVVDDDEKNGEKTRANTTDRLQKSESFTRRIPPYVRISSSSPPRNQRIVSKARLLRGVLFLAPFTSFSVSFLARRVSSQTART